MYFDEATERVPIRAGWDMQALIGFFYVKTNEVGLP